MFNLFNWKIILFMFKLRRAKKFLLAIISKLKILHGDEGWT